MASATGNNDFHQLGADMVEVASNRLPLETFHLKYLGQYGDPSTRDWVSEVLRRMLYVVTQAIITIEAQIAANRPIYFDHWTPQGDLMVVVNASA